MDSHVTFDLLTFLYFPLFVGFERVFLFLLCLFSGWTRTSFSLIEYPALIFGFCSHFEGLSILG